jgi:hypothetical protein
MLSNKMTENEQTQVRDPWNCAAKVRVSYLSSLALQCLGFNSSIREDGIRGEEWVDFGRSWLGFRCCNELGDGPPSTLHLELCWFW